MEEVARLFAAGDYYEVVDHESSRRLLALPWKSTADDKEGLANVKEGVSLEITRCLDQEGGAGFVVMVAGALVELFCRANWTGPPLPPLQPITDKQWQQVCLEEMSIAGEEVYPLTTTPLLLWLAHVILLDNQQQLRSCDEWRVWSVRCLFTWQQLLGERVMSLWEKIDEIMGSWSSSSGEQLLEMGHVSLYYLQYDKAKDHFLKAQQLVGLKMTLTGLLGKRTRFQQDDTSQLVLDVTIETDDDIIVDHMSSHFPKDVALNDDTVLNDIKLATPTNTPTLNCLQLVVLIAQCTHLYKTTPPHKITSEEIQAYLSVAVKQRQTFCWAGLVAALTQRCKLESNNRRRVERCMMQLEVLMKAFSDRQPEAKHRLRLFHCLPLSPHWNIEHDLANCLVSLGCSNDALLIYERLQLWDGLVMCLQNVGRIRKAESVLHEQLKIKETPLLWCLLGDVTQEEVCYQKAWQLSRQRNSRAQRSLGMLYLHKEKYKECVESLQLSLAISSLQEGVWFSLGHAALKLANHDLAVKAFRRCVLLDSDNAEAWNNLSAVHLKRNEKEKAFHCLLEAVKGCYDNWRIWENYLLVSTETGHYNEAISAYHRLLDLKEKFCDVEILHHLVEAATSGCHDDNDLHDKVSTLLARVTAQVTCSGEVWQLSAHMHLKASCPNYEKCAGNTAPPTPTCLQLGCPCRVC
ncbi:tetratricopeptide repeat protein 27-like isoform X2 [Dysidea avara]|uniref:tetratricopeptide repeat protein 27-like isoform X2 n=1 Tax=Dysidea avara TaxID=196820 RepID=UPI0033184389